ncbi:MAG: hypothetical protein MUF58_21685 [Arcicella sp.]|nr:hypothetical protein [Arcicella sp.]
MDETQKIEKVFATPDVVEAIFRVDRNTTLKTMKLYDTESNINATDYLFSLLSKVIFGSASYHYIIRQLFYFIFRSLSKLKSTHPFFDQVMPTLLQMIIKRTYLSPGFGLIELLENNGLPSKIELMYDKSKSGRILKMYYKSLLALYSESFLRPKFEADESDIYFFKSFFSTSLLIINIKCNDVSPYQQNYNRQYKIEINNASAILQDAVENVQPFIDYVKSIVNISINGVMKCIWLVRVDINELYILKETDIYEEKILRLPRYLGEAEPLSISNNQQITEKPTIILHYDKFNPELEFIIERVEQEKAEDNLAKVRAKYIKDRKWRGYSKLFKTIEGGKLKDNDPDNLRIGPLFDSSDFANARIDSDVIMPIYCALDPWKEVYESKTYASRETMAYEEIITFRKETWLSDIASECFFEMLNDPMMKLSTKTLLLNPNQFDLLIQSQQSISNFIDGLSNECTRILVHMYTGRGHYMLIEIEVPSKNAKKVNVCIADSEEDIDLDDLVEEVRAANIDLLAASFNPFLPIVYKKAQDIIKQNNGYDCGVCCSQRAYFWKRFDATPSNIPEDYSYLKDLTTFRLFMLSEILKHHRNRLSKLIYADSPKHKPIHWRAILPENKIHNSDDINAATELLNLSNPDDEHLNSNNTPMDSVIHQEIEKDGDVINNEVENEETISKSSAVIHYEAEGDTAVNKDEHQNKDEIDQENHSEEETELDPILTSPKAVKIRQSVTGGKFFFQQSKTDNSDDDSTQSESNGTDDEDVMDDDEEDNDTFVIDYKNVNDHIDGNNDEDENDSDYKEDDSLKTLKKIKFIWQI